MIALLAAHPGGHAAPHATALASLPLIFRPLLRLARRKPAAPEVRSTASGADRPGFACCAHCLTGSPCDPPDAHPVACSDGCNGADWGDAMPPAHSGVTAPRGYPVLGDRMLAEVRQQWNGWHDHDGLTDAEIAALEPAAPAPWRPRPTFTPTVPAREVGTSARRTPPRLESAAAAGGAPGQVQPGATLAHADAIQAMIARYLPAAPDPASTYRRPVNGRRLPDQPRQAVPFGELNRKFSDGRPTLGLLQDLLDGLRRL